MTALDFLKSKGLIKDGFTEFVISGEFGQIELTKLLKEYGQKQLPIPEMKSFYCEKQTNLLKQCANECDYCKSIKLM